MGLFIPKVRVGIGVITDIVYSKLLNEENTMITLKLLPSTITFSPFTFSTYFSQSHFVGLLFAGRPSHCNFPFHYHPICILYLFLVCPIILILLLKEKLKSIKSYSSIRKNSRTVF